MFFYRWLLLLVTALALCRSVRAQDPYYITINKTSGLPCNAVYDLFQDSKGFIWLTTDEGLTRYDGFEFRTYSNARQTSLPGNLVSEDMFGRIWYKNFDGYLYYVEHDSLKALKQNTSVGNSGYGIINDRLLVVQPKGIDIFDLRTLNLIKSIPDTFGVQLSELQYNGYYYIVSSENRKDDYQNVLHRVSPGGTLTKMPLQQPGNMVASDEGIFLYHKTDKNREAYILRDGKEYLKLRVPDGVYVHGGAYCNDRYWILSPNGLWAYDKTGNLANGGKPYFSNRNTSCVMKDREGNTWIGTLSDGILFVPDFKTRLYTIPGSSPNVLTQMGDKVYVGTKNNSIYTFDAGTNVLAQVYGNPVRHEVYALVADEAHNLLFVSSDHFFWTTADFGTTKTELLTVKDIAPIDKKYVSFAGTGASGLINLSAGLQSPWDSLFGIWQHRDMKSIAGIPGIHRGKTIACNPTNNTVYLGSNKGLHAITPKGVAEVTPGGNPIFPKRLVNYGGCVYMLSPQGSLYRIDRHNNVQTVAVHNDIGTIAQIQKTGSRLYALTTTGIREIDTVSNSVSANSLKAGIRSDEIVAMQLVGSTVLVASDRGLIVLDSAAQTVPVVTPGFIIDRILVNGKHADRQLDQLSYMQNDIDINYSILSFNIHNTYQLYYRINDGAWKAIPNSTRNLKLPSLSPGEYDISFELRSERNRVFAQQPVHFIIRKPFWALWTFWVFVAAILTVGGVAYYKWQTRLLKKQSALKLEKVELEKNLRNSMLTSIRAQMNPHFFYNALNTIQSFIFSDDKRSAATYLVKLSKLTRMILEMSEKDAVSLEEETEALKLYLELEKIRFNNDFNYELLIARGVDAELVKIPPMVVQPYIENAIKHGLLHKKGEKQLSVEFARMNGNLCVTIDDNGVGRVKAGELASAKRDRHQSFSTSANSKRIELLNKGRTKNIGVVYIDKTNEAGTPSGTTVIISIPLN